MSENNNLIDVTPIKININDIFDKKIELGPLLQFNLLQKIIEEFINRQKKTDEKINKLEIKFNNIIKNNNKNNNEKNNENNIYDLDKEFDIDDNNDSNINDISEENDTKDNIKDINDKNLENIFNDSKEIRNKRVSNFDNENNNIDNNNKNNNNNVDDNKDNLNEDEDNKSNKEINVNNLNNYDNYDNINTKVEKRLSFINQQEKLVYQLNSRIQKLENKFSELIENISSLKKHSKKQFQSIKAKNNGFDAKFTKQEKLIKELTDKMSDFNIYELFKGNNNDNIEVDKATLLIQGVDQKLSKKIEFSEMRNKANEEMLIKLKNEFIEMKNTNDSMYKLSHDIKENYDKLLNDSDSKLNILLKKYNDITTLKEIIDNSVSKADLLKLLNEQEQKMKDLLLQKSGNKEFPTNNTELMEQLNNISDDLKSYVNKNIEDSEHFLKNYISNLKIEEIMKQIQQIRQCLDNKLNKENLGVINLKIEEIENIQDNYKLQMEDLKNDITTCNDKCLKTVRMIEYLRAQLLNSNKENKEENENKNKENEKNYIDIDLSLFTTKIIFDEEINKIYKRIEKILGIQAENSRSIQDIEEKIKYLASENDLTNIEQYLINLIDDYKLKDTKKFVDKSEYRKSLKYIEIQIKHLNDITSTKDNDNWLLAKKPINNYICASCEAYLGDLKNKDEFLPWNKIPARGDNVNKKYRLGHGFSKMLKMINADLLKKTERVNSGLNIGIKIDENKKNKKSLPKINMQSLDNSTNINNINFNNVNNDSDFNEKINNSADNIDNKNEINENNYSERIENTERVSNKNSIVNSVNNSYLNYGSYDEGKPKVIKIYKKNKK